MQTAQIEYIESIDGSSILRRRWALVGSLVLLNLLDLMTTQAVLSQGGIERNPLMRPLVEEIWSGAVVKGACLALMALLLVRCPITSRKPRAMASRSRPARPP